MLSVACAEERASLTRQELLDPETCASCHMDHYREWSGSMHAYAAEDPIFLAMNRRGQRETAGALGDFCVKCHAPMAVREGATTDGLNLDEVPRALKGVTCYFCHTVDAVEGTHNNPLRLANDTVMRGAYADPLDNPAHASAYSSFHDRGREGSARLCGACHDIVVAGHAAIERTFAEWQESVFSGPGGATCGQCHMEQSTNLRPIASTAGAKPRRTHGHAMPGVDLALTEFPEREAQRAGVLSLLNQTLQSGLCVRDVGGTSTIEVILDNIGAGHGFPSGSAQDRRIWIELVAFREGEPVYRSGVVAEGEPVVQAADPDLWLLRDCLFDDAGQEVHMFWQARSYESNQLPAQVTFDRSDPRFYRTHVVQTYPRAQRFLDVVPDRVTLRIRVRPIGLDVLDDLIESGDLAPDIRQVMPTLELDLGDGPVLEWTAETANGSYIDEAGFRASCISLTNLDFASDRVPAPTRSACRP